MLPILHLNGYKIANPTVLDRIPEDELRSLMVGYGHNPYFFEVSDSAEDEAEHADAHRRFAALLDDGARRDRGDQGECGRRRRARPALADDRVPHPEGLDGPGLHRRQEDHGSWRAHQVPLANARDTPEHLQVLADWLASYRADELFDADGRLDPTIAALAPQGQLRMSDNPHANGGLLLKDRWDRPGAPWPLRSRDAFLSAASSVRALATSAVRVACMERSRESFGLHFFPLPHSQGSPEEGKA